MSTVSAVARMQWWVAGLFLIQLCLYGFAFHNFPRGWEQRLFWAPFGAIVLLFLVLALGEIPFVGEGSVGSAEMHFALHVLHCVWRAVASLYLSWICSGSFLLGAKARFPRWLMWLLPYVGAQAALWPALVDPSGDSTGAREWFSVGGTAAWAVFFWGGALHTLLRNLASNKSALDSGGRGANAGTMPEELAKRGALRLLRGAASIGAACAVCSSALYAVSSALAAAAGLLCDAGLLVMFAAVLLGLVINFQSLTFINLGHADLRRRFMAGLAAVALRLRRPAAPPVPVAPPQEVVVEVPAPQPVAPPAEDDQRTERHYDLQHRAPAHALGDDSDLVHTTTDGEEDVTAPDDRTLLRHPGNNNNDN
jgi:hypothetical protein